MEILPADLNDPRVQALETEVSRLSREVQRLSESEAFHRQLLDAPADRKDQ